MNSHLRAAFVKALIVLIPSYTVAFLTEKMVYVVPTLAAAGFFASTLEVGTKTTVNRVEEDAEDGHDETSEFGGDD